MAVVNSCFKMLDSVQITNETLIFFYYFFKLKSKKKKFNDKLNEKE